MLWFYLFLCFDVACLCCLQLIYIFIYLVKFWSLSGHLLGKSCSLGSRYVLFVLVPDCQLRFSPPWFWNGDFFLLRHFLIIAFFNLSTSSIFKTQSALKALNTVACNERKIKLDSGQFISTSFHQCRFLKKDNKTLRINNVCLYNLEDIIETSHGENVLINTPLANGVRADNLVLDATQATVYNCT